MPETAKSASDAPCTETPGHRDVCPGTAAHVAPSPNDQPDSLTVREAAAILRVSPVTIYKRIHSGSFSACTSVVWCGYPELALKNSPARTVRTS